MFNPITSTRSRNRFGLMTANPYRPFDTESNLALKQTAACSVVYSRSLQSQIVISARAGPEIFERVTASTLSLSQSSIAKREANGVVTSGLSLSHFATAAGGQQGGGGGSTTFHVEEFPVTFSIESSKQVTLSLTPAANSELVFLNGMQLMRGLTRDYTLTGPVINFGSWPLKVDDIITVRYAT